jgi:hypothetical protein
MTPPTAFSTYCRKHNIDLLAQKSIRGVLRDNGFRDPYDLNNKEVMAIIKRKWNSIQAKRSTPVVQSESA